MRKKCGEPLEKFRRNFLNIVIAIYLVLIILIAVKAYVQEKEIVSIVFIGFLVFISAIFALIAFNERKQSKKYSQIMEFTTLEEAYERYLGIVKQEFHKYYDSKSNLGSNWMIDFDYLIEDYIRSLKPRSFTDFDVAACLMYVLTSKNKEDTRVRFALGCAKQIIKEPKDYECYYRRKSRLVTEINENYKSIAITILDRETVSDCLIEHVRRILSQERINAVKDTSYFLQMLYERCKMLSQK